MIRLMALLIVCVLAANVHAGIFDPVPIEYWAGSGANESILITDFESVSYAFGYRWEGSASSWDMLQALDAAGGLSVASTDYGVLGIAIDAIAYAGEVTTSDWVTTFLGFWDSSDGITWTPSEYGAAQHPISHGSWDGWSREYVSAGWDPINPPVVPVFTPEPASFALIGLGAAVLLRRHRAAIVRI